ncbi:MAG: NFACT family protein [Lachnospiraceae bacterium]|nr:NFACT family protein [Lachnospiraceae bacterium]
MAYDGIVVAATVSELNKKLPGGSIVKVAQPEKDELLLGIKVNREQVRLAISANASVPFVCFREENVLSPVNAPAFCMSLRKHIGGGRILNIEQGKNLERVIIFHIEHLDEMGDRGEKLLIVELMGKHSNIILARPDMSIIDSIKHVTALQSSLREVLPGRTYFLPETKHQGFGKVMDEEIAYRAGIDSRIPYEELSVEERGRLETERNKLLSGVDAQRFSPNIIYDGDRAMEFSAVELSSLTGGTYTAVYEESMTAVVKKYYEKRELQNRMRAKSEDIRLLLKNLTERTSKKLDLQEKQYMEAEKRDIYKVYGELLNVYGYGLSGGEKELICENYYDENREIRIPLDPTKSASDNAKRYFDKYQKLKRSSEALRQQITENRNMLYHLDSIKNALLLSENEADLREIRREMAEAGYVKASSGLRQEKGKIRKEEKKSDPLHFVSSDGFDIYVGRNNAQNEDLSFKVASPDDWWFHAKKIPGSHVIVKTGKEDIPDKTVLEAAALAAYYSKAGGENGTSYVEVDYVKRRELKKVPGAMKGFVIYHTNYSILIEPKSDI